MKEIYTKIENHGFTLAPCPLCGSTTQLWERADEDGGNASKAVMCSRGDAEPLGPLQNGCPLFMAPEDLHKATRREAVRDWHSFAEAAQLSRARCVAEVQS